jgi:hypothetical protein
VLGEVTVGRGFTGHESFNCAFLCGGAVMSWKFWEKKGDGSQKKLPGPKDIPYPVGRHLVVDKGQDPDWVWALQGVVLPKEGEKNVFYVRVFSANDASMKKISVKNYHSLDEHPELILFQGWFDKKTMDVEVEAPSQSRPRAA